jgi:hypothetical protein
LSAGELLTVAVPPGIGDSLWSLTKLPAILAREEAEQPGRYAGAKVLLAGMGENHPMGRRAMAFVLGLPGVVAAVQSGLPIHPPGRFATALGFEYLSSGRVNEPGLDGYRLIANGAVERGTRLERWLPEFTADFDILDSFRYGPASSASWELLTRPRPPFVIYTSALAAYEGGGGYNPPGPGRWSISDWADVIVFLSAMLGEASCVIVGADYDRPCAVAVQALVRQRCPSVEVQNLCSLLPIHETMLILRRAPLVVGYPSGIPILSTYMGRPTVMFYNGRPMHAGGSRVLMGPGFPTSWVPPRALGRTYAYLRFGVHAPVDVLACAAEFARRGVLEATGPLPDLPPPRRDPANDSVPGPYAAGRDDGPRSILGLGVAAEDLAQVLNGAYDGGAVPYLISLVGSTCDTVLDPVRKVGCRSSRPPEMTVADVDPGRLGGMYDLVMAGSADLVDDGWRLAAPGGLLIATDSDGARDAMRLITKRAPEAHYVGWLSVRKC